MVGGIVKRVWMEMEQLVEGGVIKGGPKSQHQEQEKALQVEVDSFRYNCL